MSESDVIVKESKKGSTPLIKQVGIGMVALLIIVAMFATRHNSKEQVKEALAESKGPVTEPSFQAKLDRFKKNDVFNVSEPSASGQLSADATIPPSQIESLIAGIKKSAERPKEVSQFSHEEFMQQQQIQLYQSFSQSNSLIYDYTGDDALTDSSTAEPLEQSAQIPMGSVIDVVVRSKTNNHYLGSNWFGVVAGDVYSADRKHILINKGAGVNGQIVAVGSANPIIETRVALNVEKIKRKDGSIVFFDQSAADAEGVGAVSGDVNKHSLSKWGGFTAFALLGNGLALSNETQRQAQSSQDLALRDLTSNISSATNQAAGEYLSIKPTVTLKSGDLISVMIINDVDVSPMSNKRNLL